MDRRNRYLLLGIGLSIASKWVQLQYGSVWGDLLILPAAVFFVLAILLSIPSYQSFLEHAELRRAAYLLAVYACAAVLSFQLFTMTAFGWGNSWGFFLLLPVLLFAGLTLIQWRSLANRR